MPPESDTSKNKKEDPRKVQIGARPVLAIIVVLLLTFLMFFDFMDVLFSSSIIGVAGVVYLIAMCYAFFYSVNTFAILLLIADFLIFSNSLLESTTIVPANESSGIEISQALKMSEFWFYSIACSAGMMGGIMKYLVFANASGLKTLRVWDIIYASVVGLFVALILFLLFRSGIISDTPIDSYNKYGVAGISILAGFFSDRVIDKLTDWYGRLLDDRQTSEKQ